MPVIGKVSVADPQAVVADGLLTVSWKPIQGKGNVKIWLSTTNDFRQGGQDRYVQVKKVPQAAGTATVDLGQWPSGFYKVVVEGRYNTVNRWVRL